MINYLITNELTEIYYQLQQSQKSYNKTKYYVSKHKDDDDDIQTMIDVMNFYRRQVYNLRNAITKIVGSLVSEKCECW